MVPRPAQNLTIEQGAGAFRRAAVPDPPLTACCRSSP